MEVGSSLIFQVINAHNTHGRTDGGYFQLALFAPWSNYKTVSLCYVRYGRGNLLNECVHFWSDFRQATTLIIVNNNNIELHTGVNLAESK